MVSEAPKFGTSGLRGLAAALDDATCAAYAEAFLVHLAESGRMGTSGSLLLGRDLRESSPRMLAACAAAAAGAGLEAIDCGPLPTPALALESMRLACPAIMVTGSHIPADRNGLKFYRSGAEIDKADEAGVMAHLRASRHMAQGQAVTASGAALEHYRARYLALAPALLLSGKRIGVFQHSAVGRDLLMDVLAALGAETVAVARSESFVPIDTEALSPAIAALAPRWAREHRLDALVSSDGDGDRPLVADRHGRFIGGDIIGLLTARFLRADTVVTPVTSISTIERAGFGKVLRTRVGSPYVLAAMAEAKGVVVGFEANGGVLLGSEAAFGKVRLAALPTRDAMLPILCLLGLALETGQGLDALMDKLPPRSKASGRIEHVPAPESANLLARLQGSGASLDPLFEASETIDAADGVRLSLAGGEVVHFRPSGNAPELRCYVEAETREAAEALLERCLGIARAALRRTTASSP